MDLHEIKTALRGLPADQLREVLAEFGTAAGAARSGNGNSYTTGHEEFLTELTQLSERDDQYIME